MPENLSGLVPVKDFRITEALGAGLLAVALGMPAVAADQAATRAASAEAWNLFSAYCTECHNTEDWAGGIAFDALTEKDIPDNIGVMEKVVRKLRSQQMPPGGHKVPDKATRGRFIAWLEGRLDQAGAAHVNPGSVGLHRLNRKEYANAVRDLLGIQLDPAELLPRDEPVDGLDNIASALQVTPSFLDQYMASQLRRVGRPAADVHAGRRPGPHPARDFLRYPRALQCHRCQPDRRAQADLRRLLSPERRGGTALRTPGGGRPRAPRLPPARHRRGHEGPDALL